MHLSQYKLCTRKMELALEVKFISTFTEFTSPWWRTLTNGSDVKYVFPRCHTSAGSPSTASSGGDTISMKTTTLLDCTQSLSFLLVFLRDWSERDARPRARLESALPLARSSLSIAVDEKRKGLQSTTLQAQTRVHTSDEQRSSWYWRPCGW